MDRALLPQDPVSGNVKIIEPEHGVIHDGVHYTVNYDKTLASVGSTVSIAITTPAASEDKYLHFVCSVEADKKVNWTFSEGASISGGSSITSLNNMRPAAAVYLSPATVVANPVVTTAGTVLETHITGSAGTPQSKVGGNANVRNEWVLAAATTYLILATATEAATETIITTPYYYRPSGA